MSKQDKKIAFALAGVFGFLLFEWVLFSFADRPVAEYTRSLDMSHPALIGFFRGMTDLGKAIWYLPVCALAVLFCGFLCRGKDVPLRYRRLFAYVGVRAFFIFSTIAISGIVADILKMIIGRARPGMWLDHGIYGFHFFTREGFWWNGMPSGHSTTAFALSCSLAVLYPRLRVLWFGYALLLAGSRVMVDAHYLSDICAGALLGSLTVWVFIKRGMIHASKVIFPIDTVLLRK